MFESQLIFSKHSMGALCFHTAKRALTTLQLYKLYRIENSIAERNMRFVIRVRTLSFPVFALLLGKQEHAELKCGCLKGQKVVIPPSPPPPPHSTFSLPPLPKMLKIQRWASSMCRKDSQSVLMNQVCGLKLLGWERIAS